MNEDCLVNVVLEYKSSQQEVDLREKGNFSKGSSKQAKILSKVSVYTTDGKFAKHISEHLVNPYSVSVRSDVFVFLFPL